MPELVASGEFTEDEVLDGAVDFAVLTGLLTLQEVRSRVSLLSLAESLYASPKPSTGS